MPSLTFVLPDGTRRTVEGKAGLSVMQVAMAEDVPGIVAECGGNAMCATCHVYADAATADRLPPVTDVEDEMLDSTASPRTSSSRLSCQVDVEEDWGDTTFVVPDTQL
ncbi:2Fe-2S iron-sulfur cluster-binding protein [Pseudonocardia kujensis]|uniref:2Fe-2S iron-sulfur cluster-binding protein n=1 Tax=Pseudonocardia kujensis TaxID=1128675 RepID=UPI001E2C6D4F|nr:2Fe-2S iron-sulfur cluster-binding protein [Pseudonocardia kujensis]MCE0763344.1 2Fe-2S iron-sulfur cluster-binding protein [Pseudonocardia kujensis]